MIRRPLSLSLRLTLLFAIATAVVFFVFGWIVIYSTDDHFRSENTDELAIIGDTAQELFRDYGTSHDLRDLHQRFEDILIGHHHASLRLVGPDGQAVYDSFGPALESLALLPATDGASVREWRDDEHNYHVLSRNLNLGETGSEYLLTVAVPIDDHLLFMAKFRRNVWLMIAGSVVLMSLIGWVAVQQGIKPLHDISARIRRIRIDKLNTNLDPDATPDELTEFASSFNEMLQRVDSAFHRLSEFNADIAHELRTPITSVMTQMQVGLSRARTAEEYREILSSATEDCERMAQMVADMLYLAKADSEPRPQRLILVDLGKEIDSLFEFYEGWTEDRDIELKREGGVSAMADRNMMQRALANLISNAIKNTPRGGTITAHLGQADDKTATVAIENTGSDIPPEQLSRLFDRFYRTETSRLDAQQGTGLGLAIVKSIVDAHEGEIAVHSGSGRTRFTVSLPL